MAVNTCVSQQRGGAVVVEAGSSMDVMDAITFTGNTVAYESFGIWVRIGNIAKRPAIQQNAAWVPLVSSISPHTSAMFVTLLYLTVSERGTCSSECHIYVKPRIQKYALYVQARSS